ncbi:tRNA-aminoacylation cofactor arc1 [Smittium culicis]|uniref:tRNA-aminoacylation cofactor arc1 n=1 Tax=Smittium culicis TaxID=133412 RepID=A0A1R1X0U3_9FUNG|nr:tRNA-aminoacylation cofactor arc1 [Smittium culicis]
MSASKETTLKLVAAYMSYSALDASIEITTNKFSGLTINENSAQTAGAENDVNAQRLAFMGEDSGDNSKEEINQNLMDKTFLVSQHATIADFSVFSCVYSHMKTLSDIERATYNYFSRWFDLVQHLVPESTLNSAGLQLIQINLDIKPEVSPVPEKKEKEQKPATEGANKKEKKKEKKQSEKRQPEKKEPAAPLAPSMIDLRVGHIIKVEKHPDADSLYVEQIELGEAEPRTVVSGLVKHMTIEEMLNRKVILVCNLKPAAMRGVKSFAMVLCANINNPDGTSKVEFIEPPADSKPGDIARFEGYEQNEPEALLNPKKKIWEAIQPGFITSENLEAGWTNPADNKFHRLNVNGNPCKSKSIAGGSMK